MTRVIEADVCVIGAGPAGSVFATRMAQFGFDVCLIERSTFPRRHVGESLSPGVLPMLESIGMRQSIEAAGFHRVESVSTNWNGPFTTRMDPRAEGLLVDRGIFDMLLLDRAKALGVRVIQPACVQRRVRSSDGWQLRVDSEGEDVTLHAPFLADAGGRAAASGGRRRITGARTIALYAYWRCARVPAQPRIEAGEQEWFWGVPLPDGSYNTLAFLDAERLRETRTTSAETRLRALLSRSALLRDCGAAELLTPVRAADATPYVDDDPVDRHSIRIGDAGLALDPLSSSGVQKAIQTALSGAIVVNTMLRRASHADAASRFYRDSLRAASDRHGEWASGHYATAAAHRPSAFWRDRAAGASTAAPAVAADTGEPLSDLTRIRLSADVRWIELPCLGDQFVEMKHAISHPGLDAPVAYLAGRELHPLLRRVEPGMTPLQLAHTWAEEMPLRSGVAIAQWLVHHGLLERCAEPQTSGRSL